MGESSRKVRFGVIGLGYIAQVAVLPAFAHAKNCSLTALVSGDRKKLKTLGSKYNVKNLFSYEQIDECFKSGLIDAVYIALPNSMHRDCTERAARAGLHVLCEKPMALNVNDCQKMIDVCQENRVKLMIAYRLHLDKANEQILSIVRSGKIGEPRIFNSTFCMQVKKDNIRTDDSLGGGALNDIGIYCINAARMVFGQEPTRVFGAISNPRDPRFREVDGLSAGMLEFGPGKLATFACSFGAADRAVYEIIGTKGSICVQNGYEYSEDISYELTINGKTSNATIKRHDQFAPELIHFARAIELNTPVIPTGREGLADVRVIDALFSSADSGRVVVLTERRKARAPARQRSITAPLPRKPKLVRSAAPHS